METATSPMRGDYIRVSMYDDKLEILSPGRLPNTVTLDNMRETRYSRNPRIARTLVEFGWVRELNEGVKRIYTEMQRLLLNDPVFSEPDGTKVQLTLENNIVARTGSPGRFWTASASTKSSRSRQPTRRAA